MLLDLSCSKNLLRKMISIPDVLNNPSATRDFTTKLDVQQPLVNMDLLYKRKAAAKQTELYQYKTQRTKEYLTFEVKKAYLQLQLAYDAVKVLEEAITNNKCCLHIYRKSF